MGNQNGAVVWLICLLASLILQIILGRMTGILGFVLAYGLPGFAVSAFAAWSYQGYYLGHNQTEQGAAGWIDSLSGFWVLFSYLGLALTLNLGIGL